MASPWVNLFSNQPGGGLNVAMRANNSLANENILRQINQIKKHYMPLTTQADINSKNAYARLVGLQPLGKILGNEHAYSNTNDEQKNEINQKFMNAGGIGKPPFPQNNNNSLNQMPQGNETYSGTGQPSTNSFSEKMKNAFHALIGQKDKTSPNAMNSQQQAPQMMPQGNEEQGQYHPNDSGINNRALSAYDEWMRSPEGKNELAKGEAANVPDEKGIVQWSKNQKNAQYKSNAEKEGEMKGTIEQGKEGGKFRAQALNDIGKAQLALSNSGTALTTMTKIIKNPVWQEMRDTIPAFQDKQLGVLKVTGTHAQKKLIGEYTSAAQSLIAATVQGMGSRHLVREYNLAERQKINDSDTTQASEGKLKNIIELHDIAEQKNNIIADALRSGTDEAEAVKLANKMVDVDAIEKRTESLLADKITNEDIDHTAKETGMTRQQVIKRLKKEGRYHG